MDGANKEFIRGKDVWLQSHMIFYNVNMGSANPFAQPTQPANASYELDMFSFDLRAIPKIAGIGGGKMAAYQLCRLDENIVGTKTRSIGSKTRPIRAYFLPWGTGKTYEGQLGSNADFFFTPTLNGCTFAVRGNANPVVVHSNYADPVTQQIDQGAIDRDLSTVFGAASTARTVKRSDYKLPPGAAQGNQDYRVTIVGCRYNTGWKFFFQRYKTDLQAGQLVNTALAGAVQI